VFQRRPSRMDQSREPSQRTLQLLPYAVGCLGFVVILTIVSIIIAVIAFIKASWILWSVCCFVSFFSLVCFVAAAILNPLRTEQQKKEAEMPRGLLAEYPLAKASIIVTIIIHALSYIQLAQLLLPTPGRF